MKCSFHFWSLSSCLATFGFALEVFFLSSTSFTVCRANLDCLSSTEFLILLIWPWRYYRYFILFYLIFCVCFSQISWDFLKFLHVFIGFLLWSKNAFLCYLLYNKNYILYLPQDLHIYIDRYIFVAGMVVSMAQIDLF